MKPKIAINAICKDEEKFATRWMQGVQGADGVFVLDTGSSDRTVKLLRAAGAHVEQQIITPWRFDVARNLALDLVPETYSWVLHVDLDEIPTPGYYAAIQETIKANPNANRLFYTYVWNWNADGTPATVMQKEKLHRRGLFKWRCPVHEVLVPNEGVQEVYATCEGFQLHHHADDSKSRANYLPLLLMGIAESPDDDRLSHYAGRELHFHGLHPQAIVELQRHLSLPKATWLPERANSMKLISKSYQAMGYQQEAITWAMRACAEAPLEREPWLQLALAYQQAGNHEGCVFAIGQCLKIVERPMSYISEATSWGALPYDLLSVSLYYLGAREDALHAVKKALEYEPDNPRLLENLRWMQLPT